MKRCPVCDSKNIESNIITHKYKESGLDYISLLNVPLIKCKDCDEEVRILGDEMQFLEAIAFMLIKKESLLIKCELRF